MIPGILLSDIVARWRDRLQASAAVNDFCQTRFGKSPRIYLGTDAAAPPQDEDCPFIVIQPVRKTEGTEYRQYRYTVLVRWAVVNSAQTVTGAVTELAGLADCDRLGQLILAELASASAEHPLSYVKYQLPAPESLTLPRFEGSLEAKIYLVPAMGGNIVY